MLADEVSEASPFLPWKQELAKSVRNGRELAQLLGLDEDVISDDCGFSVMAPRPYIARMEYGNPLDPLLLQVLPQAHEAEDRLGFVADPVGEHDGVAQGYLQKYNGRALLVSTPACAIHCRYCFRRHFPYEEQSRSGSWWDEPFAACAQDTSLDEIIFSGGDPWVLPDSQLQQMVQAVEQIPHIKRLRWHTRLPIVLPQRVDEALCEWIRASTVPQIIVLHCNHANEIDDSVREACQKLRGSGALLLNQAVLLAGVNDSVAAQSALGEALVGAGVTPYYVHMLDPVAGAAHFFVPEGKACELMRELHATVSGYMLPRLVREVAGDPGKRQVPWWIIPDVEYGAMG